MSALRGRVGVIATLALTSCSSGKLGSPDPDTAKPASGKIPIAYLQMQGDLKYFISEANGTKAKAKAKELEIDLHVVNLVNDAGKFITEPTSAIASMRGGLIVVVPEAAAGPQVVAEARAADITLLTSEDQVCTDNTDPAACAKVNRVPRIGFSGTQMGGELGKRAVADFAKPVWEAADTRILCACKQDTHVGEHIDGATAAGKTAGFPCRQDHRAGHRQHAPQSSSKGPFPRWLCAVPSKTAAQSGGSASSGSTSARASCWRWPWSSSSGAAAAVPSGSRTDAARRHPSGQGCVRDALVQRWCRRQPVA